MNKEARDFLCLQHQELGLPGLPVERLAQVYDEMKMTGSYWHTQQELAYGAKLAWRNNTRCVGRLHWSSLKVRDMRHLTTADDVFQALVEHIELATNGGKIQSLITVFAPQQVGQPGIRIWNPQLIRYAGYTQEDGTILGDPLQVELTQELQRLGWSGGKRTPFDILPIVIQMPRQEPEIFELPTASLLEVPIIHPQFAWFHELNLKWHALPVISDMCLEIGGVRYTAAPFNGWYMGAEIAARNFGDAQRYNVLPLIAEKMDLDTRSERSLWRDRALVELNVAVLHSFAQQKISIVDHHTVCRQFVLHEEREQHAGREVPADWAWIVPPLSGSTTPLFHRKYKNIEFKPNFFCQQPAWQMHIPTEDRENRCPFALTLPSRRLLRASH